VLVSRLAPTARANLANELAHALDVSEATVAELVQRLEEAEAVIAGARKVRARVATAEEAGRRCWKSGGEIYVLGHTDALAQVAAWLDQVDGL